jgi:hypothetical protein
MPRGFEWATPLIAAAETAPHEHAASDPRPQAHEAGHASARHHHAVGDASVHVDPEDPAGPGMQTDTKSSAQGPGGSLAWATPCAGLRVQTVAGAWPEPAGPWRWSDCAPGRLDRPPQAA